MNTHNQLIWISLSIHFYASISFFVDNELQLTLKLIDELEIRRCLLIANKRIQKKSISDIKRLSSANVLCSYFSHVQFANYFEGQTIDFKTLLIFKEEDLPVLYAILYYLKENDQSYELTGFIWTIFLPRFHGLKYEKFFIPYDCQFIIIESENGMNYTLTEIYHYNNKTFLTEFGTWDYDSGLRVPISSFYLRRQDMNGSEIRSPTDFENGNPLECLGYEIIRSISHKMNFQYKFANDLNDENEKAMEILYLGASPTTHYYPYKIGPVLEFQMNWFIKQPDAVLRSDYYLKPFKTSVWLTIILIILSGTVLDAVIHRLTPNKEHIKRTWTDDVFLTAESFCNQCGNNEITKISLRITCIILRLSVLVLVSSYGGTITTYFSIKTQPEIPFKNKQEFIKNGQYSFIIGNDTLSLTMEHLQRTKDPIERKIRDNFTIYYDFDTADNFYNKLCYEKLAAADYTSRITELNLSCKIFEIPEPLAKFHLILYLRPYGQFTKVFNHNFFRLYIESGINRKRAEENIMKKWEKKKKILADSVPSIKIQQMKDVLSIPFIGIVLSLLIVSIEYMCRTAEKLFKSSKSPIGC